MAGLFWTSRNYQAPGISQIIQPSTTSAKTTPLSLGLTAEERLGQHFLVGFDGQSTIDAAARTFLKDRNLGGVILFGRNIASDALVKSLVAAITALPKTPPFIAVDQEGGLVARLRGDPTSATSQRQISTADQAFQVGKSRSLYLKSLGFNLNFAPVVDLATSPKAGIYGRAFPTDPGTLGDGMVQGCVAGGILCAVKHFPSFGNFSGDVEGSIPLKKLSLEEFLAFRTALAQAEVLMVSPVYATNIDPDLPAPISAKVMRFIREELGFSGIIITDDLEMASVKGSYDPAEFALRSLQAGVDIVLFSRNPGSSGRNYADEAYQKILQEARSDADFARELNDSVERILLVKNSALGR